MNLFADDGKAAGYSGITQLVLLLTLYPYVLDHGLFQFSMELPTPEIFDLVIRYPDDDSWSFNFDFSHIGEQIGRMLQFSFLMLIFPFGLLPALWRRQWGWAFAGLAVPWTMLSIVAGRAILDMPPMAFGQAEVLVVDIAAKVAFLWLVWRGRLLSRSFVLFMLILFVLGPLSAPGGIGVLQILRPLVPAVVLVLSVVLVRLIVLAVFENARPLRRMGFRRSLSVFVRTTLVWAPVLMFSLPYFLGTAMLKEAMIEKAYGPCPAYRNRPLAEDCDVPPGKVHLTVHGNERDLRTDMLFSISLFYQGEINRWTRQANQFENSLRSVRVADLSEKFGKQFDEVIGKRVDFDTKPYTGFLSGAKNFAVDTSQDTFNAGFSRIRDHARERLVAKVDKIEPTIGKARDLIDDGARKVRDTVNNVLKELNRDTQLAVWWTFAYVHAAHRLAQLFFILICIKSFMYVFSRIAFSRASGSWFTLGDGDEKEAGGTITRFNERYDLGDDEASKWFVSRRFQPHGKPPRISLPQPGGAPIARLLHGAFAMNRLEIEPGRGGVNFTATGGAEFVEWRIGEGEQVVFEFRNFVGMSQGVRISTLISARLSSLVLGRIIFSTACGPGTLLLLTDGRSRFGAAEELSMSIPPRQLAAFAKTACFHVDSSLRMADIYFSSAYVRPLGGGMVIIDVDRQEGAGTGLGRFVRHFLWPG